MPSDTANPKDAMGSRKLSLHLVPSSLIVAAAEAFTLGALKYGKFNWRVAGVRASIYADAILRHAFAWLNGEEIDPVDGVPHLAAAAADIAVLIDAKLCGMLIDDRPPMAPVADAIHAAASRVAELQAQYGHLAPHQWTIGDTLPRDMPSDEVAA